MEQVNAITMEKGMLIAALTVIVMFGSLYVMLKLEDWDKWCQATPGGWVLLLLIVIKILRIVTFPLLAALVVFGMYGVATTARDFWHRK
jgi:hypothetical protein